MRTSTWAARISNATIVAIITGFAAHLAGARFTVAATIGFTIMLAVEIRLAAVTSSYSAPRKEAAQGTRDD